MHVHLVHNPGNNRLAEVIALNGSSVMGVISGGLQFQVLSL